MTRIVPTAEEAAEAMRMTMKELAVHSRVPFRKILAQLIGCAPTAEAILVFAEKHPDRWAQAVAIFGGLAGFEKGLVSLNFYDVGSMSDVALLAEIAKGDEGLAKLGLKRAPVVIEQPPQAEVLTPVSAGIPAAMPNPLGATADNAQENRREAPRPAAELHPPVVERDEAGNVVDPAGAV